MRDNLDISKIRESFERTSEMAPPQTWDAISDELNNQNLDSAISQGFEQIELEAPLFSASLVVPDQIDEMVQESFERIQVMAPNDAWDEIQDQFDTDLVWQNMAGQIKVRSNAWSSIMMAASLAFLSVLIPGVLSDPIVEKSSFGSQSGIENKSNYSDGLASTELGMETNQQESVLIAQNNYFEDSNQINVSDHLEGNNLEIEKTERAIQYVDLEKLPVPFSNLINNQPLLSNIVVEKAEIRNGPKWSIGAVAGLNSTWIFDNETRSSFGKETLIDSKLALGESYGFTTDVWFNEKNGLTSNIFIQSATRNKLGYYDNGLYKVKNAQIDFFKMSILYNRKFTFFGNKRNHNLILKGGLYAGFNKRSYIKEGNVLTAFNSTYKKFNYGLNFQLGQEYELGQFVLGYGVNSELGLRNILKSTGLNAPSLNYTNNLDAGIYLTLKYRLN